MEDSLLSKSEAELRSHITSVLDSAYELDKEIGRGGMGIVFKARDRRLKRAVAGKLLPPELAFRSEIRSRFLREAETAAQLSHPNIVPIYAVDEKGGLVFFVMGFVDGGNLAKRIHDGGPMPPDEVRRILSLPPWTWHWPGSVRSFGTPWPQPSTIGRRNACTP